VTNCDRLDTVRADVTVLDASVALKWFVEGEPL
jgi:hypothetical protein